MNPPEPPVPYQLIYADRVRDSFVPLIRQATALGVGTQAADSVREIDRLLRLYPQFGEPVRDLTVGRGVVWVGFVGPLTVHYALHEDRREVWGVRPVALTNEPRLPPPAA